MAVVHVREKHTGSTNSGEIVFAAEPAAGNTLWCFITKSVLPEVAPVVTDDKGDVWEVSATKAKGSSSANATYFAVKKAAKGTEKNVKATGETVNGMHYGECSGSNGVIDKIVATDNVASGTTNETGSFTSGITKGLLLCGLGNSAGGFGTIETWEGTGPVLETGETTSTRCYAGHKVITEKVEAKTFKAKHATARSCGMLVVTLQETPTEAAPTVTTEAATAVATTTATLNATVNPNGKEVTTCKFEYGTTEAYGSEGTVEQTVGAGSSPVAVTLKLTGLTSNTTYHFRISATNAVGTSKGADKSLKTEAILPEAEFAPTLSETAVEVPVNTALPTISGTAQQGQTLTASNGSWTNSPTSFAYQWLRCDSAGANAVEIAGATSSTYVLVEADVGSTVRVRVTASNAGGPSSPATSAQTAVVTPLAPVNTGLPTISGEARQGKTLTEAHGTWTNNPTSYEYQWLRCDAAGANCSSIAAATAQTYTLVLADVGSTIRVRETAINAGGPSSPATSAQTAVVLVEEPPPATPGKGVISIASTGVKFLPKSTRSWSLT